MICCDNDNLLPYQPSIGISNIHITDCDCDDGTEQKYPEQPQMSQLIVNLEQLPNKDAVNALLHFLHEENVKYLLLLLYFVRGNHKNANNSNNQVMTEITNGFRS